MFSFFGNREDGEEKKGKVQLWLILIGAIVGVALILFGSSNQTKEEEPAQKLYSPTEDELVLYQNYLEERVKVLCESVEGVSGVTAVVTLSGSFESVYATELSDGNEEYVIIGSGSNATALFLSRSAPEIAGIGIVCYGGSNVSVRRELISLISATFHLPSNRIYITEAGG